MIFYCARQLYIMNVWEKNERERRRQNLFALPPASLCVLTLPKKRKMDEFINSKSFC